MVGLLNDYVSERTASKCLYMVNPEIGQVHASLESFANEGGPSVFDGAEEVKKPETIELNISESDKKDTLEEEIGEIAKKGKRTEDQSE